MVANNELSFAPSQPDVYSDKVRMRNLKGLFTGPVFTCLNLAAFYVDDLRQRRIEKAKRCSNGEIHHVEKHTILICNTPATGAIADM